MKSLFHSRAFRFLFVLSAAASIAGCTASFGPGYTINKQEIDVRFEPGPPPHILLKSNYDLTNTGTRALPALELRLPAPRRFKSENVRIEWDGKPLTGEPSPEFPRNTLLALPGAWALSASHRLSIEMDLQPPGIDEHFLSFAPDAFFLPAEGWAAELLPSRGAFAAGGVPPAKWNLTVHVPQDFVIHSSGYKIKTSKHAGQITVRATQRVIDIYPYVIAGRYQTKQIGSDRQKIYFWTRQPQDPGDLREVSDSLTKTLQNYNSVFGGRTLAQVPAGFFAKHHGSDKNAPPLWLVECPALPGCFSDQTGRRASLSAINPQPRAGEMISLDSAVLDLSPGVKKIASFAAPALAATWLGYGQSPGFYEQDPPLSEFPAFAAAVGNEVLNGASARTDTIRRALALVPKVPKIPAVASTTAASTNKEDASILRAKSFLFFYALQDRYGQDTFRKAIRHMLDARRSSGFDLDDLIAAFDQESHRNTAEFVRLWMKHPGVPPDFRARYENTSADTNTSSKEITP